MRASHGALLALLLAAACARAGGAGSRYGFYRAMDAGTGEGAGEGESAGGGRRAGGRRVFGGRSAALEAWGAACALLDRYWATRCSATVLAPRWALTAAHCVTPHLAYVKYNARRPAAPDGDVQPVLYLYRHPGYKVVLEDEGRGMDVTLLHHDVGLVRTRADMRLARHPELPPLGTMSLYDPIDIRNEEVEVLGFGRTERSVLGEELFSARLRVVACERGAWFHCACGAAAGDTAAGVCAGDSGGPVLYRGAQVGVTSMGPLECAGGGARGGAGGGTSVFTALARYAALINGTMHAADAALHMERLSAARRTPARAAPAAVAAALLALLSAA